MTRRGDCGEVSRCKARRERSAAVSPRARIARTDWTFAWYIGAALLVAVAGGFTLALLLPLARLEGWDWGARWPALVQAHGHLQVVGWVGLFVAGMAFRLVPRFAARPLRFPSFTPVVLALLLAGLMGRVIAQPWLDRPGMHTLLMGSALSELIAATLFAVSIVATLVRAARTLSVAPFFLLGCVGLLAQALLGFAWLSRLMPSLPVLTDQRDGVLLGLQFYGFLLPFVLGVSLRAVPAFFRHRTPSFSELWGLAGLLAAGTAISVSSLLLGDGAMATRARGIGAALTAAAMLGAFFETGIWKPPLGLRPSARAAALLLRTAYLWLLVAAVLLAVGGAAGLIGGSGMPLSLEDAIRHILALGVFSTSIAAMAQLLLPLLAQRRLQRRAAQREVWILWTLFTLATTLRMTGALLQAGSATADSYRLIALSGLVGISGVLYLALTMVAALRRPPDEIALLEIRSP